MRNLEDAIFVKEDTLFLEEEGWLVNPGYVHKCCAECCDDPCLEPLISGRSVVTPQEYVTYAAPTIRQLEAERNQYRKGYAALHEYVASRGMVIPLEIMMSFCEKKDE